MSLPRRPIFIAMLSAAVLSGCSSKIDSIGKPTVAQADAVGAGPAPVRFQPGPNIQEELQTALIQAKPGAVIELDKGKFEFTKELSLTVENVTIRGQGRDETILSFKKQDAGKHGLLVTRGKFCIEDLTVEDTQGDALKVNDAEDVIFRRVRARWTDGEKESNGAYGIYPVQCKNVLVEECEAIGASDAGIYVGQSRNVIVRRCRALRNVAGIEIENCTDAEVYDNVTAQNAGGLLVFDLPGLQAKNGRRVSVHDNRIFANNHPNFAPKGNMVASVSPGTGAMIMATDQVEFFNNTLENNDTFGLCVISFTNPGKAVADKEYDPYPEGVYVHDNRFFTCGKEPKGEMGLLLSGLLGKPMPEIIYDGEHDPAKMVNGKVPPELGVYFENNGNIQFANLGRNALKLLNVANGLPKIDRDLKAFEGKLPRLAPVVLPTADQLAVKQ
jgi:parallel beta-helix repeat protein